MTVTLRIGDQEFTTEIARTDDEIRTGLMNRRPEDFPAGSAMLFILPQTQVVSVWNFSVQFDIDVAFIFANGQISEIVTLNAGDLIPRFSSETVDFFLEVNAGEFEQRGIFAEDVVDFPPEIP